MGTILSLYIMRKLTEALILTDPKEIKSEINQRVESIKIVADRESEELTDEITQLKVVHAIESNKPLK